MKKSIYLFLTTLFFISPVAASAASCRVILLPYGEDRGYCAEGDEILAYTGQRNPQLFNNTVCNSNLNQFTLNGFRFWRNNSGNIKSQHCEWEVTANRPNRGQNR